MKWNTKKRFALLMTMAMVITLVAGCGSKKEEPAGNANLPNPLTEVSAEEMATVSGIALDAPERAEGVKYYTIADETQPIAQVIFSYEGAEYTYRAQSTGEMKAYDMSGLYYDNWETGEADVAYCVGTTQVNSEAAAVYWIDIVPGINYTLSCSEGISAEQLVHIAELSFVPAQGDSAGDVEADEGEELASIPNGHFEDADFDTVDIFSGDGEHYEINVGIYRLAMIEGEGTMEEGCVLFTGTAPDGSDITGRFFRDEEDTYSLIFTDSKWDLIEGGTLFEGFSMSDRDLSGHYLNGQDDTVCDSVRLEQTEPGMYNIEITINGQEPITGTAGALDGGVEFVVEAADGNVVRGYYYPTGMEIYTLLITESDWDQVDADTEIADFVLVGV